MERFIKKVIKKVLLQFGLLEYIQSKNDSIKLPTGSTVLVHIGKCGGSTLRNGINNAMQNSDVQVVHMKKPIYRNDLKYIIIARGPISRLSSAFRWRYKRVVTDGKQRNRVKGEYDALVKYGSLNNLAEALYHEDGTVNTTAQQESRRIEHIREDISFYLVVIRDILLAFPASFVTADRLMSWCRYTTKLSGKDNEKPD